MNKKGWISGVCLGLLGLVIGVAAMGAISRTPWYVPPLKVIGDVVNSFTLQEPNEMGKLETISLQGNKYKAVKLAEIINRAQPVANAKQLYLVGLDGFTSAIKVDDIDDCYISFSAKNGWEAVNLKHPISSNAKQIKEIVVVSDGSTRDFAFNVIDPDKKLVQITPGQLLARPLTEFPYPEGKAVIQNDGKEYESQVFTKRRVFKLSDLTPVNEGDSFLVLDEKGEYRLVDNGGYFEVSDNHINYLQPDTRSILEKVKGVIVRPPAAGIMDIYYDTRHYLDNGDRILVAVLDGLTYNQYSYAVENGYAPFLENYSMVIKASGVYPPAANVSLAAMLTGKEAKESCIITAGDRELKVPSIFAEAVKLKKQSILLEADQKLLETEVQPVSVTDKNGSGGADDELYEATLANLDKGYDLLMVRFHGIDDSGARYGESAEETMQSISAADEYLKQIVNRWPGKVIITGNQAACTSRLVGGEAQFSNDAMFVPYWRAR